MLEWKNVTDDLPENSHQLQGRRIELYEVAEKDVELGLFSCPDGMWGILVCYGKMYGTAYAPSDKIWAYRDAMKPEIEAEYERHRLKPSPDFIRAFSEKYQLTFMSSEY